MPCRGQGQGRTRGHSGAPLFFRHEPRSPLFDLFLWTQESLNLPFRCPCWHYCVSLRNPLEHLHMPYAPLSVPLISPQIFAWNRCGAHGELGQANDTRVTHAISHVRTAQQHSRPIQQSTLYNVLRPYFVSFGLFINHSTRDEHICMKYILGQS